MQWTRTTVKSVYETSFLRYLDFSDMQISNNRRRGFHTRDVDVFRKSGISLRLFNKITWNFAHQDSLWNLTSLHQNNDAKLIYYISNYLIFRKSATEPCDVRGYSFAYHISLNISRDVRYERALNYNSSLF